MQKIAQTSLYTVSYTFLFTIFLTLFIFFPIITEPKLYQVVTLTRHGARYHVNSFGDGDDTKPLWGQLTAVGMRQHQKLGRLFRAEYIQNLKFLSPVYNSSQIQIYSTPYNRTLLSIQSQLYGLYPLGTGPRITYISKQYHLPPYSNKSDIQQQNYALPKAYQPIKIKQSDQIMISNCPNFQKYSQQNFAIRADQVREMNVTYYPFFVRIAPMFKFNASQANFYTMLRVMDVVNVDNYLGRPLPQNWTQADTKNIFHLGNWYFCIAELNKASLMYNSGKFQKILNVFDLRVRLVDNYALKWIFLSGHDTDIIAMHLALNLSSSQCIQQMYRKNTTSALNCQNGANYFAASMIFQLHSNDNGKTFYVKIRSNGKYVKMCNKNSTECQYLEFKNLLKKNIANNVEQLCGRPLKNQNQGYYSAIQDITVAKNYHTGSIKINEEGQIQRKGINGEIKQNSQLLEL